MLGWVALSESATVQNMKINWRDKAGMEGQEI